MKLKWTKLIAWLICASLLFTGCGCTAKKPGETTPSGAGQATTPADTTPEATTIAPTTPADTTPVETTPVDTTPVDTTPVETTPPETTPVETTPAPSQPSGSSHPGGTGGFEGGSTGTVTPSEPEEVEVPVPGAAGNPFAESVLQLPDSFSTFPVAAGDSITYRVSGLAGSHLTIADPDAAVTLDGTALEGENGAVTVDVPYGSKAVTVTVTNTGSEEKAFTLEITPLVGSQANPEEIQDISSLTAQFVPGKTQHFYRYVPADPGVLTLVCGQVTPETAVVTLEMTDAAGASTTDETGTHMDVAAGQEVIICVSVAGAEEATAQITGTFEATLGTLSNPIPILDVEAPFTSTVPGESTVYYSGYLHEMTLHMLNYEDVVLLIGGEEVNLDGDGNIVYTFPASDGMGRPQPIVFGLKNTCDTETVYTLTFTYPLGSLMNPAQMVLGDNTATIRPDNMDGYNYVWTAEEDGILILSMQGDNWQYVLNNLTQGVYGEIMDASMEPSVAEISLEVSQGDEIALSVNGFDSSDPWALPGGTVSFSANLSAPLGSYENPIPIADLSQSFVATIPAEEFYYYTGMLYDVDMEAYGAYGLELTFGPDDAYDEDGYFIYHFPANEGTGRPQPVIFCLSNATGEDASYTLNFIFPAGSSMNPAELLLGENTAQVAANSSDGYIYNWVATGNGELTIAMEGTGWSYTISNLTSGIYGDTHLFDDETVVDSETVTVAEGDLLQVVVNTYDPESFSTPAGSIIFTASFVEPDLGTEANPEEVMGQYRIVTSQLRPATNYYYDVYGCSGMIIRTDATITVNGEAYDGSVLNVGRGEAVRLVVINDTETSNRFIINFEFPEGHPENPDEMNLGTNSATLAPADETGYTYTWTASADGTLVIVMNDGGWQYVLSNETAGTVGELMDSSIASAAVSKLEVKAGDKVGLNVNAFDPADPWSYPGGEVSFTASFYDNEVAVELLAEETASGKQVTASSGELANGGKAYLVISAVTDKASGSVAAYSVNGAACDGSGLLVLSASEATQWAIAQENGSEVEVSYAVIYVYEIIPAQPEVTEPETTEPEATEPETTEPETTEPETTEPETTEPETTEPETTEPETTEPETTEPETTEPPKSEEVPQPEETEPEPAPAG